MADSLSLLIKRLKRTTIISSNAELVETLVSIEKFASNSFDKAYLLGHLFKYKLDSDNLRSDDKDFLIDTIKNNKLETYFYLKSKPQIDSLNFLIYIFIPIGLIAIILGVAQLINGDFWYGLGTKYLVPIIREGGYKIILGIVLLVGGLFRFGYERKRKKFLNSFLSSGNISTDSKI
jgi:hypothetical protein